jgi:hypothetical protein
MSNPGQDDHVKHGPGVAMTAEGRIAGLAGLEDVAEDTGRQRFAPHHLQRAAYRSDRHRRPSPRLVAT